MKRRGVMGLLASALALAGCWPFYPSETIRYRMTVEVDTPQGIRRGSGVIESKISAGPSFGATSGIRYEVKGEAIAVDLPDGRIILALLISDSKSWGSDFHASLVQNAVCRSGQLDGKMCEPGEWAAFRRWARRMRPVATVATTDYPTLVTFADVANPRTIVRVDPYRLGETFGPGVKLRRITIAVTDDPVTTGIEKRLGWLPNVYKMGLGPEFKPKGIPVGNFKDLFSTELGE